MSILRFITTGIFLILEIYSFAQAPGYLGKRLFAEGNIGIDIGLAFVSSNNSTNNPAVNYNAFRNTGRISISYVTGRHHYISLEATHTQFSANQDSLFEFAGLPSLKYRITNQSIGLGFFNTTRKTTQSLAPLGFFFGYKFTFWRSFVKPVRYVESKHKFSGVQRAAYNLIYRKPELNFLGFAISSGFRTILKDKYTLNYAIDLGYNYPINKEYLEGNDERRLAFSREQLRRNNSLFMSITVGAGVLLY